MPTTTTYTLAKRYLHIPRKDSKRPDYIDDAAPQGVYSWTNEVPVGDGEAITLHRR